jgi:oligopeptide/dipeptide ABC transporter ATP-binding protein
MKLDTKPLVELDSIRKYYYVQESFFSRQKVEIRAVDNVSFSLFGSSTLALVGESGCGKTTLAKLILQLLEPTSGRVSFSGGISNIRKDVQLVFQNPYNSLNPLMRIGQIIQEPLIIHRLKAPPSRRAAVIKLLGLVGLSEDLFSRFPSELSGGQRQRVSLARALATEPKILILDEPVSSLDVRLQEQILFLLKQLKVQYNLSLLFITHNLAIVKNFCDTALVMYLGKIMEQGSSGELFGRPLHPYTQGLLLAAADKKNQLKADMPRFAKIRGCIFNTRCPYAKDRCFEIEPILEEKTGAHFAACHFPLA